MNKTIIPITLFSILLLFACHAVAETAPATPQAAAPAKPSAKYITGPELENMMKDGKPIIIIDVRDGEYFRKGHIPGALNIPTDTAYNKRRLGDEFQPKDRIVVVGYAGTTGTEIIDLFVKSEFSNVYGLKGGMREWQGPVQK